jgi:hypothetical protein
VLADRLRLANGIGYALENRLALSRSTGSLLSDIHVRRVARFFSELRSGIARTCSRESPRIALLTPGRLNQSYPEQAHLARYLGFPLVEGRDLTVSNDRLYVRTIAGPKRIDALWRWIDTNALDPPLHSTPAARSAFPTCSKHGDAAAWNWPTGRAPKCWKHRPLPRSFRACAKCSATRNRSCPISPHGGAGSPTRPRMCATSWARW